MQIWGSWIRFLQAHSFVFFFLHSFRNKINFLPEDDVVYDDVTEYKNSQTVNNAVSNHWIPLDGERLKEKDWRIKVLKLKGGRNR